MRSCECYLNRIICVTKSQGFAGFKNVLLIARIRSDKNDIIPAPTPGKWLQRKTRSPLFQRERIWSVKHGAAAGLCIGGRLW